MSLQDLCEPVFLCLCRVRRRHRAGVPIPARQCRDELARLLAEARAKAGPKLLPQFERIEPALIGCISRAARSDAAQRWPVPSEDDHERFFKLLREDLEDPSPQADERLEVLASCAALAFISPDLPPATRETLEQLRLRLACESLSPLSPLPRARTIDLARPSARPAIAFVAIALAALAAIAAAARMKPPPRTLTHAGARP